MLNDQEYTISELADLAGVTPRTVRYYVSIGLLVSPGQGGPGTKYGHGHLQRLRLIRKLQQQHLPLGEIGARLESLDDEAIEEVLAADDAPAARGSALEYIRQLQTGHDVGGTAAVDFDLGALEMRLMSAASPIPSTDASPASSRMPRSQWERVQLSQNVELHIRRPSSRADNKRVERLIRIGREILEEDPS
jgi:DNA-binding transcriptional MerR regulator